MTREDLDSQLIEHAQRQTKALETIALIATLFAVGAALALLMTGIVYVVNGS